MQITLTGLLIGVAIVAVVLTAITTFLNRRPNNNLFVSYVQNFCGALFIFSGFVKAADPLGTAYKLDQYFAEFESTFADTAFSFLAPMFPALGEVGVALSVGTIMVEILIGIALIIGAWAKLTTWSFFGIMVFFTFLTGFTYLTGYVPDGVNFFDFSGWGDYVETNMKVTDCGCFGDFLVLKPKVSFLKDIFLLFPAVALLFSTRKMHQLATPNVRTGIVALSAVGLLFYCLSNYVWNIPGQDFRPFRAGENVRVRKFLETTAASNIGVTGYRFTNKETGEVVEMPTAQYMTEYKKYPKEKFDVEQLRSESGIVVTETPAGDGTLLGIEDPFDEYDAAEMDAYLRNSKFNTPGFHFLEDSKISAFEMTDDNGNDPTYGLLTDPNYSFLVVAYQFKYDSESSEYAVQDTTWRIDTMPVVAGDAPLYRRSIAEVNSRMDTKEVFTFDEDYVAKFERINETLDAAQAAGLNVAAVTAYKSNPAILDDFRHATQSAYPFYQADDILLKTIVRSNPGVLLLRNGEIIAKWHHSKLPDFETLRNEFMDSKLLVEGQ